MGDGSGASRRSDAPSGGRGCQLPAGAAPLTRLRADSGQWAAASSRCGLEQLRGWGKGECHAPPRKPASPASVLSPASAASTRLALAADYDPAEEYPGTAAFSEPEAALLLRVARALRPHVWASVHSGMDALFMPYDHKAQVPGGCRRALLARPLSWRCPSLRRRRVQYVCAGLPCGLPPCFGRTQHAIRELWAGGMGTMRFSATPAAHTKPARVARNSATPDRPLVCASAFPRCTEGAGAQATLDILKALNERTCRRKCATGSGGKSVGCASSLLAARHPPAACCLGRGRDGAHDRGKQP